jgi:hypothetical protein
VRSSTTDEINIFIGAENRHLQAKEISLNRFFN